MKKYYRIIIAAIFLFLLVGWSVWTQFDWSSVKATTSVSLPGLRPGRDAGNAGISGDKISSSVRIPFTLTESNNISVRVVINGTEPLNLLFHTAVDSISLTTAAVKKMQTLVVNESVEVESWGGTADSGMSRGNRVQIGDLEWNDQTIFVDGLSGPGTDGKFGPNLFAEKILEINFDNRELVIHPTLPKSASDATSTYQRLDLSIKQGSMYIAGELAVGDNRFTNQFMVHSGFGGTALLDDEFVRVHQLASLLETISERELKDSFGNVLRTRKVKLTSLDWRILAFLFLVKLPTVRPLLNCVRLTSHPH